MNRTTTAPNWIERILNLLDKFLSTILAFMVFGIFAVLLVQVVLRYFFSTPLYWAEEAAKYLMVYVTSIGAATAYKHYVHPRLMMVVALISRKYLMWYDLAMRIPVAIFFIYLAQVGWGYALANEWMLTPGLQISFFWPFFAIPCGAVCVLTYLALDTINILVFRTSWILEPEFLECEAEQVMELPK